MCAYVPSELQDLLNDFAGTLKDVYGNGLVSVFIYGSAASGEFTKKRSNINVAVILTDASLKNLSKLSRPLGQYRFRLLEPVFFSEEYMRQSLDVFPIEFLDMKENYAAVCGKDILQSITVDPRNLRFQCEQELKAKLINIKRSYLRTPSAAGRKELLFRSLTSSLHIMRNLLRLKGVTPPYAKPDIIERLEQAFNINMAPFKKALGAKLGQSRLAGRDVEALFFEFVETLENVVSLVDRL